MFSVVYWRRKWFSINQMVFAWLLDFACALAFWLIWWRVPLVHNISKRLKCVCQGRIITLSTFFLDYDKDSTLAGKIVLIAIISVVWMAFKYSLWVQEMSEETYLQLLWHILKGMISGWKRINVYAYVDSTFKEGFVLKMLLNHKWFKFQCECIKRCMVSSLKKRCLSTFTAWCFIKAAL